MLSPPQMLLPLRFYRLQERKLSTARIQIWLYIMCWWLCLPHWFFLIISRRHGIQTPVGQEWKTSSQRLEHLLRSLWSWLLTSKSYPAISHEAEISPLLLEAARQTYLTINSSLGDTNSESLKVLNELLKEIDYVPLAIHLLATVGRGFSPSYLLGQWREECTKLLELRKDWQSSITVSISISLSQLKITNNPEALHLLGILFLLPDGLSSWTDQISQYWPWIHQSPSLGSCTLADIAMFSAGRNTEGSISNSALYPFA